MVGSLIAHDLKASAYIGRTVPPATKPPSTARMWPVT
jgi:hypothetical protein